MWHDISAGAQALVRIAKAIEKIVDEEFKDEPKPEEYPLTKIAWQHEVAAGNTEMGFAQWLADRRDLGTMDG
jgi:hypothetical protein